METTWPPSGEGKGEYVGAGGCTPSGLKDFGGGLRDVERGGD